MTVPLRRRIPLSPLAGELTMPRRVRPRLALAAVLALGACSPSEPHAPRSEPARRAPSPRAPAPATASSPPTSGAAELAFLAAPLASCAPMIDAVAARQKYGSELPAADILAALDAAPPAMPVEDARACRAWLGLLLAEAGDGEPFGWLARLAQDARAAYYREPTPPETPSLCPAAPPMPSSLKLLRPTYRSTRAEWEAQPGWRCLKVFGVMAPEAYELAYQYEVASDPARGLFTAWARRRIGDHLVELWIEGVAQGDAARAGPMQYRLRPWP